MNLMLGTGVFVVCFATLSVLDIARRRGERFEYAGAMFMGELGLMFIAGQLFHSVLVTIGFGASMLASAILWWRLFHRYANSQSSGVVKK